MQPETRRFERYVSRAVSSPTPLGTDPAILLRKLDFPNSATVRHPLTFFPAGKTFGGNPWSASRTNTLGTFGESKSDLCRDSFAGRNPMKKTLFRSVGAP